MKIYVKNMACESCKFVVREALEELNIAIVSVELGEIETRDDVTDAQKMQLNTKIKKAGLELLEKGQGVLIEKIKKEMIKFVYNDEDNLSIKFSVLLSKKLNFNYTYLANFYSEVEASTIEHYMISLKVERIKELILNEELTLSEIAHKLNYSSVAYFSNQFKKMTGLTPSHFKDLRNKRRKTIQVM